jgi:uncharacterized protein (TIGR00266 family)
MEISIKASPAYAAAFCVMRYGEGLYVERGAMMAMSSGVRASGGFEGKVFKALKRKVLGDEDFIWGLYQAEVDEAWVAVAPSYPGDMEVVEVTGGAGMLIEQGSLVAAEASVSVDVRVTGLKTVLLSEGVTMLHLTGEGLALVGAFGGMLSFDLDTDESLIVDSSHLVGMSDTVRLQVGVHGSAVTSVLTGEGIVGTLFGPGRVMIQTRSEERLGTWLFPQHQQPRR